MEFWRTSMPAGMLLRSACDWHLDPCEIDTIEAFLAERGETPADVEPLSLAFYLEYAEWFRGRKEIEPIPARVSELDVGADGAFSARLDDGSSMTAERVLLAPGFAHFAHVPADLAALIPEGRRSHTVDCVDLEKLSGKRCLIIGGRQSAFEWAALLAEAGASAVHVCHRHDTPSFVESDWSWVNPMLERIAREPRWYRDLSDGDRDELSQRFWREGRLKLEPWLTPRLAHPSIELLPNTAVVSVGEAADGALEVGLDRGGTRAVDHVVFATGYKVDMARLPYLSERIRARMETEDGFPSLDEALQTTVPGLHVTSLPATRAFGLFFGFTSAVRASALIVGKVLSPDL